MSNIVFSAQYEKVDCIEKEIRIRKDMDRIRHTDRYLDKERKIEESILFMNDMDAFLHYDYRIEDGEDCKLILQMPKYMTLKRYIKLFGLHPQVRKRLVLQVCDGLKEIDYHGMLTMESIYTDGLRFYLGDVRFFTDLYGKMGSMEEDLSHFQKILKETDKKNKGDAFYDQFFRTPEEMAEKYLDHHF